MNESQSERAARHARVMERAVEGPPGSTATAQRRTDELLASLVMEVSRVGDVLEDIRDELRRSPI
ncbi:MAG: hypothetical protein KDK91_34150 [Gammaproteobacteria bacterium]|nr:hypothetical protein [Gammaproteobacteria bacterium]